MEAYNPPKIRAIIQAFILLPANLVVGFFLGELVPSTVVPTLTTTIAYENNWKVFLGKCSTGSILCKSIWKTLVRIEGVTVFLIGLVM